MTLLELYDLIEMARTRGDASWAVLDWAAKQPIDPETGEPRSFTIRDAYRIYTAAGGMGTEQQFSTIFNKWVAKYDPKSSKERYRDKARYGLSQDRPLVITRSGRRGFRGAASYQWGLDAPLRQAPTGEEAPEMEAEDPVGDALDKLEEYMGGIELKRQLAQWRAMTDMNSVMRSVMTLPARMRAEAMLVASQHLVNSGRADQADVQDAERKLAARASAAPEEPATPFKVGQPRTDLSQAGRPGFRPRPPQPAPEPEAEADVDPAEWEDDAADKTQPDAASPFADVDVGGDEGGEAPGGIELRAMLRYQGRLSPGRVTWDGESATVTDAMGNEIPPDSGVELQTLGDEQFDDEYAGIHEWLAENWPSLLDPPSEGGPDLEAEMRGEGGEEEAPGEEGETEEAAAGDFPDWTPATDPTGSAPEQAMYRLVNEYGVGPDDPLWEAASSAEDEDALSAAVADAWGDRPRKGFRDALSVALFGFGNAFEVPEEYETAEPEEEGEPVEDEPAEEEQEIEPEAPVPSALGTGAVPDWLPRPDENGLRAEAAMYDILTDMPKARGFEDFDASDPLFSEIRRAANIDDVYTIVLRRGVPRIMVKKFLTVARAVFEHDGRDPETGGPAANESAATRLVAMMEDAVADCEEDPAPDPSKRGPVGIGRLLPMYGMDEGPNTEPVDFAPKSGLAKIMRVVGRGR